MIKQVIDRLVFILDDPHHSCFMGGIWIAGNYHFLRITGTLALVLISKQESVRKNKPFQFSPPHFLWAAEITSSSWDPSQQSEAGDGLNPSSLPLQQGFHPNQSQGCNMSDELSQLHCLGALEYFWKASPLGDLQPALILIFDSEMFSPEIQHRPDKLTFKELFYRSRECNTIKCHLSD